MKTSIFKFFSKLLIDFNLKRNREILDKEVKNVRKTDMSRFLKTEIIWESTNNKWIVKRYNSFNNTNDEFDLFDYHIHSLSKNGLKSPLLFPYVYWKDIIHRKNKLLSILIEFTNYNEDLYKYTVLLKAIKLNGQQVVDGFSSTETDVIDQVELLKNILLFLEFAEKK